MANDESKPRVLLDTNVLVSAAITDGKARAFFKKAIEERKFLLVTSDALLNELMIVLRRPKFKTSEEETNRIILGVSPTSTFRIVQNNPNDDVVLNTAYDGRVNTIVTGDKHLLRLRTFKGIRIEKLSEAMRKL